MWLHLDVFVGDFAIRATALARRCRPDGGTYATQDDPVEEVRQNRAARGALEASLGLAVFAQWAVLGSAVAAAIAIPFAPSWVMGSLAGALALGALAASRVVAFHGSAVSAADYALTTSARKLHGDEALHYETRNVEGNAELVLRRALEHQGGRAPTKRLDATCGALRARIDAALEEGADRAECFARALEECNEIERVLGETVQGGLSGAEQRDDVEHCREALERLRHLLRERRAAAGSMSRSESVSTASRGPLP